MGAVICDLPCSPAADLHMCAREGWATNGPWHTHQSDDAAQAKQSQRVKESTLLVEFSARNRGTGRSLPRRSCPCSRCNDFRTLCFCSPPAFLSSNQPSSHCATTNTQFGRELDKVLDKVSATKLAVSGMEKRGGNKGEEATSQTL